MRKIYVVPVSQVIEMKLVEMVCASTQAVINNAEADANVQYSKGSSFVEDDSDDLPQYSAWD